MAPTARRALPLSERLRRQVWGMARLAERPACGRWWIVAAAAAGVVPLLGGFALGTSLHQPVSAALIFLLVLAAVADEQPGRAMLLVLAGFGFHAAVAIALSEVDPVRAAACMPDGHAYWEAQRRWITTGADPEYDWRNWAPHHVQLLVGVTVLAVASLGLAPLFQGVYEVDLMNHYVGRLLAGSADPATALLLGWHPWSVLRGLCYTVLVVEISTFGLERVCRRTLTTPGARRLRLGAALALFAADAVAKIVLLEPVRSALAHNLLPGIP